MRKVMLIAILAIAVMLVASLSPAAGEYERVNPHNPEAGTSNEPPSGDDEIPNGPYNPYPGNPDGPAEALK